MACIQHRESYHGGQSFCYAHSLSIQHKSIWLIALFISLSLHAAVLWQRGGNTGMTHPKTIATPTITWLQIQAPVKPQLEDQKINKPKQLQKKHIQPKPIKPKQLEPKQIQAKAVKAIPVKTEPEQPYTKAIQPNKKVAITPTSQTSSISQTSATPSIQQGFIQQQKQQYLALIMQHIEQYKRYPKAARRRGIEGIVSVSFMIQADGSIHQVQLQQGPNMLQRAVRKALNKATPLPSPPNVLSFPILCHFSMQFLLQS